MVTEGYFNGSRITALENATLELHIFISITDISVHPFTFSTPIRYRKGNTFYDRMFYKEAIERYDKAIERYDKAIEINPNLVEAWKKKGYAFCGLVKYEEGIKSYDKALSIRNNDGAEPIKTALFNYLSLMTQAFRLCSRIPFVALLRIALSCFTPISFS